jgi:uncharacterized protein
MNSVSEPQHRFRQDSTHGAARKPKSAEHRAALVEAQQRRRKRERRAMRIETFSGQRISLRDPDPSSIRLEDVAHGLSACCRFAGQTRVFYSVAEHSVLVANRLAELGEPPDVVMAGLWHDSQEAYLGDASSPLKPLIRNFRQLEATMWQAIVEGLGLGGPPVKDPRVKKADEWALAAEVFHLLPSRGVSGWGPRYDGPPLQLGLAPAAAEQLFLDTYARLQP